MFWLIDELAAINEDFERYNVKFAFLSKNWNLEVDHIPTRLFNTMKKIVNNFFPCVFIFSIVTMSYTQ